MGIFSPKWKTDDRRKLDKAIEAVQKIKDSRELQEIALNAGLAEVKREAIKRIADPNILKEIAISGKPFECSEAIAGIKDPAILKELVFRKNQTYPAQAVMHITDQEDLMEIAKTAPAAEARKQAVRQFTSQDALKEIIFNIDFTVLGNDGVVAEALSRIDDIETLEKAAAFYRTWGRNAGRTLNSARLRKIELMGNRLKENEVLVIRCRECGKPVVFHEYWDQALRDSWQEKGDYQCGCRTHRASKDGFPEEPAWEVAVSERPEGDYIELCPVCMNVRRSAKEIRSLEKCFHLGWNPGEDRDRVFNTYKTIIVPYCRAEW